LLSENVSVHELLAAILFIMSYLLFSAASTVAALLLLCELLAAPLRLYLKGLVRVRFITKNPGESAQASSEDAK
jgi:hypothetical protein